MFGVSRVIPCFQHDVLRSRHELLAWGNSAFIRGQNWFTRYSLLYEHLAVIPAVRTTPWNICLGINVFSGAFFKCLAGYQFQYRRISRPRLTSARKRWPLILNWKLKIGDI